MGNFAVARSIKEVCLAEFFFAWRMLGMAAVERIEWLLFAQGLLGYHWMNLPG